MNTCWHFVKQFCCKRRRNDMIQLTKSIFNLELISVDALCLYPSGVGTLPCIQNGGSPFRFYDYPRITDVIFTGPYFARYRTCSLTSRKSRCDTVRVRRRVDYLSSKDSSKGHFTTPLIPLFISHTQTLCSKALGVIQTLSSLFASRSWSVRYV